MDEDCHFGYIHKIDPPKKKTWTVIHSLSLPTLIIMVT